MAGMRHLAAVRARLLSDAFIAARFRPDQIYQCHMADVQEADMPAITIFQKDGKQACATFAPRMWDPCHLVVQIYSQAANALGELSDIYERVTVMLHEQCPSVSNSGVTFHQIREIFANSGIYDRATNSWQLTCIYEVRAHLRNV